MISLVLRTNVCLPLTRKLHLSPQQRKLTVGFPARHHSQHMNQVVLVVASEANAPVPHSDPVLGRLDVNQAHYVVLPGLRKVFYRVDHAAPHGRIEPLQSLAERAVASGTSRLTRDQTPARAPQC
jgi:hypothetical protein